MEHNPEVDNYILKAPEPQKSIMEKLRVLIHESVPGTSEEFKWGRPVFRKGSHFSYFKTTKAHFSLGLMKAEKLVGYEDKIEGTGKDMKHIKLKNVSDIDDSLLRIWFQKMTS